MQRARRYLERGCKTTQNTITRLRIALPSPEHRAGERNRSGNEGKKKQGRSERKRWREGKRATTSEKDSTVVC